MVVLLLLRGAEDDIGAPHGRSPSVISRLFPKVFACVGQPLVMLVLEDVGRGTGGGISNFPEAFDEFVASVVGGQSQKRIVFVFGDDISDILLQPVAIILLQFLFFLAKTDSAGSEEDGCKKQDRTAEQKREAGRAAPTSSVAAISGAIQVIHRKIPYRSTARGEQYRFK